MLALQIYLPVLLFFILLFNLSLMKKKLSVVDIGWGPSFIVLAFALMQALPGHDQFQQIIFYCVIAWGLRLGHYLFVRNWSDGEDFRYQQMKDEWQGNKNIHAFFKIFVLQSILCLIVGIPVILSAIKNNPMEMPIVFYTGLGIFVVGFLLESIADWQLYFFKKKPKNKGKRLKTGAWSIKYPNYTGEIILWWGIATMAFTKSDAFVFIGSSFITFFIIKVSGVNFLEKRLQSKS